MDGDVLHHLTHAVNVTAAAACAAEHDPIEDIAARFGSAIKYVGATEADPDTRQTLWGKRCKRGFHLSLHAPLHAEEWLQDHVELRTDPPSVCKQLRDACLDATSSTPHVAALVAGSGSGKTKAFHDLGLMPDGPLVIAASLTSSLTAYPAFGLLRRVTQAVHRAATTDSDAEVASVCLDAVVLYLLAHVRWSAYALEACLEIGVGLRDPRRTLLRTWNNEHGMGGAGALFAKALRDYNPRDSMKARIQECVARFRAATTAFGLVDDTGGAFRPVIAIDQIQEAMVGRMALDTTQQSRRNSLFDRFVLAIRKFADATASLPVGFIVSGTSWSIVAATEFQTAPPTTRLPHVYDRFGRMSAECMVGLLKLHFDEAGVNWGRVTDALRPLEGRPRWFSHYFLQPFLLNRTRDCGNSAFKWESAVVAMAEEAFRQAVSRMCAIVESMLTSEDAVRAVTSTLTTVSRTSKLSVVQACIYAQLATAGVVKFSSGGIRVLASSAVCCGYPVDDITTVDFNDEPVVARALGREGIAAMTSGIETDPGFAVLAQDTHDKGTRFEHYVQWAILRSTLLSTHKTLRCALGSLVVTRLPQDIGDLRVCVTHTSSRRPPPCSTSLAYVRDDATTLLCCVESSFGPHLLLPTHGFWNGDSPRRGVVVIQAKNAATTSDFSFAAKSVQPGFAYMQRNGVAVPAENAGAHKQREVFKEVFSDMKLHRGYGSWVRAVVSAVPWTQHAIELVDWYNTTPDGAQWPIVLLDLSKQTRDNRHRMLPCLHVLQQALEVDCSKSSSIPDGRYLRWGGLEWQKGMSAAEWMAVCKDRLRHYTRKGPKASEQAALWQRRLTTAKTAATQEEAENLKKQRKRAGGSSQGQEVDPTGVVSVHSSR